MESEEDGEEIDFEKEYKFDEWYEKETVTTKNAKFDSVNEDNIDIEDSEVAGNINPNRAQPFGNSWTSKKSRDGSHFLETDIESYNDNSSHEPNSVHSEREDTVNMTHNNEMTVDGEKGKVTVVKKTSSKKTVDSHSRNEETENFGINNAEDNYDVDEEEVPGTADVENFNEKGNSNYNDGNNNDNNSSSPQKHPIRDRPKEFVLRGPGGGVLKAFHSQYVKGIDNTKEVADGTPDDVIDVDADVPGDYNEAGAVTTQNDAENYTENINVENDAVDTADDLLNNRKSAGPSEGVDSSENDAAEPGDVAEGEMTNLQLSKGTIIFLNRTTP